VARVRERNASDRTLAAQVADFNPEFLVHWDAPRGTAYQLRMWLPELEKMGRSFIVILRNPATFDEIVPATTAPVLVRRSPASLDVVVAPSVKAVFYVNNASRNVHMVRYVGPRHIQLNHGDSDKPPSFSPVF